jgi:hypothetical protein
MVGATFALATVRTTFRTGAAWTARSTEATRRSRHPIPKVAHQFLELFDAELIVLVGVEFLEELSRRRGRTHRTEAGAFGTARATTGAAWTARAASFGTAGTTTFPTTALRRTARTRAIGSATFTTAASFTRATSAAVAEVFTSEVTRLLTLVVAEFTVLVFVETLQHPLVHLFAIGTTFAFSRRRFVSRLFGVFICTRNACQRRQHQCGAAVSQ